MGPITPTTSRLCTGRASVWKDSLGSLSDYCGLRRDIREVEPPLEHWYAALDKIKTNATSSGIGNNSPMNFSSSLF